MPAAPKTIVEQILEVRFRPNARVLDHRGDWAEVVSQEMGLEHWKIVENRLDLWTKDKKINAFISFRNFGIVIHDAPTSNFFRDKASKFIGIVMRLPEFADPLQIERFGVRQKVCSDPQKSLDEIAKVVREKFIIADSLATLGGAENIVDSGVLVYFKADRGQINIRVTSNDKDQLRRLFPSRQGEIPDTGWVSDIDYFSNEKESLTRKNVTSRLTEFSTAVDQHHDAVVSILNL